MAELNFSTGFVTYNINGVCEVSFNPTDMNFLEKLFHAFDALSEKQDELANLDGFEPLMQMDKDMRAIIDGAFGKPVCEAVFGTMNVYALSDGLPVWCHLIRCIIDVMTAAMEKEKMLMDPALEKYLAKYRK